MTNIFMSTVARLSDEHACSTIVEFYVVGAVQDIFVSGSLIQRYVLIADRGKYNVKGNSNWVMWVIGYTDLFSLV